MRKVTVIAAAVALVGTAPADARSPKSACQKLAGKDLAPSKTVKLVVKKRTSGASDLIGCVLPKGKVRTVATGTADRTRSFHVRDVAGQYVLLDTDATATDHARTSSSTSVFNLKTGGTYFVSRFIAADPHHAEHDYAAFITNRGTAVAAVGPETADSVQIRVYSATGTVGEADEASKEVIPPTSLQLNGNVATWVHGRGVRTLTI